MDYLDPAQFDLLVRVLSHSSSKRDFKLSVVTGKYLGES